MWNLRIFGNNWFYLSGIFLTLLSLSTQGWYQKFLVIGTKKAIFNSCLSVRSLLLFRLQCLGFILVRVLHMPVSCCANLPIELTKTFWHKYYILIIPAKLAKRKNMAVLLAWFSEKFVCLFVCCVVFCCCFN